VIVRLAAQVIAHLEPGGLFLFEFGDGQEEQILDLIAGIDELHLLEMKNDLQGIPRTAVVQRR
jgi:hypothetical protein